jgi:hypothetical protein
LNTEQGNKQRLAFTWKVHRHIRSIRSANFASCTPTSFQHIESRSCRMV